MDTRKAATDIARLAKPSGRRGFFWKDILKFRFTAFWPRNARSSAVRMLKERVGVGRGGLHWKYWRMWF